MKKILILIMLAGFAFSTKWQYCKVEILSPMASTYAHIYTIRDGKVNVQKIKLKGSLNGQGIKKQIFKLISNLGIQGYELITVYDDTFSGKSLIGVYYFKKPVE